MAACDGVWDGLALQVNFGECFVRFPYIQWVTIDNSSDHSAKYEVLPQDEHSAIIAEYKTDAPTGQLWCFRNTALRFLTCCVSCQAMSLRSLRDLCPFS